MYETKRAEASEEKGEKSCTKERVVIMSVKKSIVVLTLSLFGVYTLSGCTKDEILDHYNNIFQSAHKADLTGNLSLQGEKRKRDR